MSPLNITQPLDSIRYMVYNGYYKVMSNIPKMGHLTTPVGEQNSCFQVVDSQPGAAGFQRLLFEDARKGCWKAA